MERNLEDLTLGYAETVNFALLTGTSGAHEPTFRMMATPDGSSYVITYSWADGISKTFNDREEAFYIDGINEQNADKAASIFQDVYALLMEMYEHCPNQLLCMEPLVEEVVQKYTTSRH